jgi:hypothetical protein
MKIGYEKRSYYLVANIAAALQGPLSHAKNTCSGVSRPI